MIGVSGVTMVLESSICIAILSVVMLRLWRDARLDSFRQEMFVLRDQLFDYAAAGNVPFDDPAYRLLRQMMNGLIRYGHQISFFRFSMTVMIIKLSEQNSEPVWSTKWELALSKLDKDSVRDQLKNFHEQAMLCMAKRLVFGSPVLIAVVTIAAPFVALNLGLHRGVHSVKQLFAAAQKSTLPHILDTRMIENEAARAAA